DRPHPAIPRIRSRERRDAAAQVAQQASVRLGDVPYPHRATDRLVVAATAEATAAAIATAAAARRALLRLAHVQRPTLEFAAVERADRLLGIRRRTHLDEAEAARPPSVAIGDNRCGLTRPHLGEQRFEIRVRGIKG